MSRCPLVDLVAPATASPPSGEPRWRLIGLAVMTLIGVSLCLAHLAPEYVSDGRLPRIFLTLEQRRDALDTIFLGPSFIRNQVIPAVFDHEVAQAGFVHHSLNLGIPGMKAFEFEFVLDQLLALHLSQLHWLIIDPFAFVAVENIVLSERNLRWHDPPRTRDVLALLLAESDGAPVSKDHALFHLQSAAMRLFGTGRGPAWLYRRLIAPWTAHPPSYSGYRTADGELIPARPHWQQSYAQRLATRSHLRREPGGVVSPTALSRLQRDYLRRICAKIRDHGITPIFLVPPTLSDTHAWIERALREEAVAPLLSYADPAQYPELFALAARYDAIHLNHEGSQRYTTQIAHDMVALRQQQVRVARSVARSRRP